MKNWAGNEASTECIYWVKHNTKGSHHNHRHVPAQIVNHIHCNYAYSTSTTHPQSTPPHLTSIPLLTSTLLYFTSTLTSTHPHPHPLSSTLPYFTSTLSPPPPHPLTSTLSYFTSTLSPPPPHSLTSTLPHLHTELPRASGIMCIHLHSNSNHTDSLTTSSHTALSQLLPVQTRPYHCHK